MQTILFPQEKKEASYNQALNEYKSFVSKGANVHLVLIKSEDRYSVCFNSKNFIKNKLSNVYELIQ